MSARPEASYVAFDGAIDGNIPLSLLWDVSEEYSTLSPRHGMRYWSPGNLLLREHLGADFDVPAREGVRPTEILTTTDAHFDVLRSLGMSIVSYRTEPNKVVYPIELPKDEAKTIAFSATKYIPKLRRLDKPRAANEVKRLKIERFILDPLYNYLDWCDENNADLMLTDIFSPDQYGWDEHTGTIALYDIDPYVLTTDRTRLLESSREIGKTFSHIGI